MACILSFFYILGVKVELHYLPIGHDFTFVAQ